MGRRFNEYADIAWRECPPKEMLWYPTFICEGNYYKHKIMAFFYHYVPAYIIDTLTRIVGKKNRELWVFTTKPTEPSPASASICCASGVSSIRTRLNCALSLRLLTSALSILTCVKSTGASTSAITSMAPVSTCSKTNSPPFH